MRLVMATFADTLFIATFDDTLVMATFADTLVIATFADMCHAHTGTLNFMTDIASTVTNIFILKKITPWVLREN